MMQPSNRISKNPYHKEEIDSDQNSLVSINNDGKQIGKQTESFDYLIRCQNNLKNAICLSAFTNIFK